MLRVLSWNLMHGRSVAGSGRDLLPEFAAAMDGWCWDVAVLQEVPPWWPELLAQRLGCAGCHRVLTSRNALLSLRRAVAIRRPDLIKSNGGGCNAILVRGGDAGRDHRSTLLRRFPERRRMHAVRLAHGTWIGNLHAQGTLAEAQRAAQALRHWAGAERAVLAGDFNLRAPQLPGFRAAGGHGVDLMFARGLVAAGEAERLERGTLSDHAPVIVTLVHPG